MILFEDEARRIAEGLLFIANEPVDAELLAKLMAIDVADAQNILEELAAFYAEGKYGFCLKKAGKGYQFATDPVVRPYIEKMFRPKMSRLSKASLEVMAIVAYRQPITRGEIEEIRGVKSEGPLNQLLDRELVMEIGRKETPGRPILYGTTLQFLRAFGLETLDELPQMEAFKNAVLLAEEDVSADDTPELQAEEE